MTLGPYLYIFNTTYLTIFRNWYLASRPTIHINCIIGVAGLGINMKSIYNNIWFQNKILYFSIPLLFLAFLAIFLHPRFFRSSSAFYIYLIFGVFILLFLSGFLSSSTNFAIRSFFIFLSLSSHIRRNLEFFVQRIYLLVCSSFPSFSRVRLFM